MEDLSSIPPPAPPMILAKLSGHYGFTCAVHQGGQSPFPCAALSPTQDKDTGTLASQDCPSHGLKIPPLSCL